MFFPAFGRAEICQEVDNVVVNRQRREHTHTHTHTHTAQSHYTFCYLGKTFGFLRVAGGARRNLLWTVALTCFISLPCPGFIRRTELDPVHPGCNKSCLHESCLPHFFCWHCHGGVDTIPTPRRLLTNAVDCFLFPGEGLREEEKKNHMRDKRRAFSNIHTDTRPGCNSIHFV